MTDSAREQTIRDAIFEHEIFTPGVTDHVKAQLEDFCRDEAAWPFTAADIEAALAQMQTDGFVLGNRSGYWWSTPAGQIAREQRWQASGRRQAALRDPAVAVTDLVLALVHSEAASIQSKADNLPRLSERVLPVYLAHVTPAEHAQAVQSLMDRGLLVHGTDFHHMGERALISTPQGDRAYAQEVVPRLGLQPPATILAPAADERLPFDELGLDPVVADNLRFRWEEAARCVDARAWLAASTVFGSILELVLRDWLRRDEPAAKAANAAPKDRRTRQVLPLDDWSSAELIKVAAELQHLDPSLARHANAVRDTRNLIHPDRQIRERSAPDGDVAQITQQVVRAVLQALARATRGGQ